MNQRRSALHIVVAALVAGGAALVAAPAQAQSTTADPFKDPRYMSGYREVSPGEVPEELQEANTLERIKGTKRIVACGDPYAFPSTEITDQPRGYDVDLFRRIAADEGWDAQFVWVNTANRGGLNRAFRTTIRKGACDVFLGLGTGGLDDVLQKSRLTLIKPTFGVGYVLVSFDPAMKDRTVADLAKAGTRVGATYFSPTEAILESHGLKHESFNQARRAIQAMADGQIDVILVPSTSLADARREHPDKPVYVMHSYEPDEGFHWNNTWAVRAQDPELKAFLEGKLAAMSSSGQLQSLLAGYGIPYFAPFAKN